MPSSMFHGGDRVLLRTTSQFWGQSLGSEGTVERGPNTEGWYHVDWDNGEGSSYRARDLDLIRAPKLRHAKPIKLRPIAKQHRAGR